MSDTLAEPTEETAFLDLHKKFVEVNKPSSTLAPIQEAALSRFETLGFPHSKHEMYTFVSTKKLVATPFAISNTSENIPEDFIASHIYAGCENSCLVFVNGTFNPARSKLQAIEASVKISSLDGKENIDSVLASIENENDVFACLANAFCSDATVVEVEDKTQVPVPIQVLFVSSGDTSTPVMHSPRLIWKIGKLAEAKVIQKYVGVQTGYFTNGVQDWMVSEGAGVVLTQVQADPFDAWNFSKTRVHQKRNSRFHSANSSTGSVLVRHHYEARLEEEGAELILNGVSVLGGKEQVHNFVRVHHEAPQCVSHQHFKNVVNDEGRSSFDGTVIVNQGAQLTNSNQLINNLMLSNNCHADNKPNLMIFADDVKCTHGATIGQIDEDQMFYLQTRGLSEKFAKELLTRGFAESIIQTIEFPEVVKELSNTLLKKLEASND
ncbi:MAG: Fe-S cluster assembly protein SufD [Nitrospina sp.]|jgi:Fe-S cluster assembly protein SufD|nr:Fe-S cluster assembly protein SufD [Nitrospina sp.]